MTTDDPTGSAAAAAGRRARSGWILVAAIAVGAVVLTGWAIRGGQTSAPGGDRTGSVSGEKKVTGSGPSGDAQRPVPGAAPSGQLGTGATGLTTSTSGGPQPTVVTEPEVDADLGKVQVEVTPGSCKWNVDTLDLTAVGNIRNLNPVDVVVSIDVTFLDASGQEIDVASDLAGLGPAGAADDTAAWDVLGASIDPPAGGLRCKVALS